MQDNVVVTVGYTMKNEKKNTNPKLSQIFAISLDSMNSFFQNLDVGHYIYIIENHVFVLLIMLTV